MGMVTLHLVIGVGVFLMPLFLLLFSTLAIPDFDFDYGKSFTPHMAMQGLSSVDHTNIYCFRSLSQKFLRALIL